MIRCCFYLWSFGMLALMGCGSSSDANKVPCHPVKGTLSIHDKPAGGAMIIFVLKNEATGSPRPRATVGDDGTFQLSTDGLNDGAPVGEYGIIVIWPGPESDDRLNGRYDAPAKTKQSVKIAEGKNDLEPIKLK